MQQTRLDSIDLQIIRLLARDSRISYNNIASIAGITPIAIKKRINKMVSADIIRRFATVINPVIFGYEKECILIVKNIDKTIKEQEIFKKISLLGDIFLYIKQLEQAAASFVLFVRDGAEGKIGILTEKPVIAAVNGYALEGWLIENVFDILTCFTRRRIVILN